MPDWNNCLKFLWRGLPQSWRALFFDALFRLRMTGRPKIAGPTDALVVCGPFRSNSGIGRGARLYADECASQGRDVYRLDMTEAMRMPPDLPDFPGTVAAASTPAGAMLVVHANPPQFQLALLALGEKFLRGRHIRAYWAWEYESLPPVWLQALTYVDSLEVPSQFVADILRRYTALPVSVHPHHLAMEARPHGDYAPGGILRCLYIFDAGSSWERKNPDAALEVFKRAFKPGEATLCFKIAHAGGKQFERFKAACQNTPGVSILTDILTDEQMADLWARHDVYVSLHRSEGFGLTILEALRHGLYALATGWSGNMDFMDHARAIKAPFTLAPMHGAGGAVKGLHGRWAEPDLDACAEILINLRSQLAHAGDRLC